MSSSNLENNYTESKNINNDYEIINFKYWFKFLIRNKNLIGSFTLISLVLAIIYSLTIKRVWEGQFQIVLNSDNNNINRVEPLAALAGISKPNDLKTEVEILKSPSVLMPIYEYTISLKNINDNSSFFRLERKFKN